MSESQQLLTEQQKAAAAAWMSRRDRGLSASEQDAYLEWLVADPAHALAIQHLEKVWQFCDQLEQWRPAHSNQPNPDLLAPARKQPRFLLWGAAIAATAAAMALFWILPMTAPSLDTPRLAAERPVSPDQQQSNVLTGENSNQKLLEDGSVIEMSSDAIIELAFSEAERRVHLIRGEAFFTVAHDASRPFVVEVTGVTVQALGTVFSVGLDNFDVAVEVTEGSVEVRENHDLLENDLINGITLAAGEKVVLRYRRLIPYDEMPGYDGQLTPKD